MRNILDYIPGDGRAVEVGQADAAHPASSQAGNGTERRGTDWDVVGNVILGLNRKGIIARRTNTVKAAMETYQLYLSGCRADVLVTMFRPDLTSQVSSGSRTPETAREKGRNSRILEII